MKPIVPSAKDYHEKHPPSEMKNQTTMLDLKEVFQYSPLAFYATDSEGLLTFFNESAVKLFGEMPKPGSEMHIHSWKLFYSDGTPMPVEDCPMTKCLTQGKAYENSKMAVEGTDGNISQLLVFSRPVLTTDGKVKGAYHTMVDITPHHKTDLKQETLSAIVDSSDDAVISKDLDGTIISWNRGAEKIFGYTEAEIIGKPMRILIPENRRNDEELLLNKIRKGKGIDHFETIRKHKNGQEIPISLTISPIKDGKGEIVGASKVARDISERLKGEEKQAVLSAIVESSDDAIISKNLNGIILSWNKGAEQIFGYSDEETLGKPVTMLIPSDRYAEEDLILEKVRSGGRVDHFETVRMHKSGKNIFVSLTVSPIRDSTGKTIGASKIARDISAQVKAKEEIARHTRNLEILNALGKSISRKMDVQAVLQQVTNATTQLSGAEFGAFFYNVASEKGDSFQLSAISGVSPESFQGIEMPGISDLFLPTYQGTAVIRNNDLTQEDTLEQNQYRGFLRQLQVKSYLAVPVVSPSGDVLGGLFLGHSKSSRFTAEHEDLVTNIAAQAAITLDNSKLFERVTALSDKKDEFIALASHELRTPLTTINGYLQMLAKTEKDKISELFLNKSLYQVNKLNTLVEDLLNMSRIEAGRMEFNTEDFDLCDLLREVTQTFSYTTKTHKLIHKLGNKPAIVHADKQRIEQAINNLMSNAIKYSPKADKVYLKLFMNQQGEVEVAIKDEGIGLSPEQQKKLFSRFYRAGNHKGISGLGLGLYLTKQIIDRHEGRLHLKSESGKGSEFIFTLPLATGQGAENVDN